MEFKELLDRAIKIKQAYALLNRTEGGKRWSETEYLNGLVGDVGDLSKLIMAKKGFRFDQSSNVNDKLARELSDCLWSIIMISDELDINIEEEFTKTLNKLQNKIADRKIVKPRKAKRVL